MTSGAFRVRLQVSLRATRGERGGAGGAGGGGGGREEGLAVPLPPLPPLLLLLLFADSICSRSSWAVGERNQGRSESWGGGGGGVAPHQQWNPLRIWRVGRRGRVWGV